MVLIDAALLSRLRALQTANLPNTCAILTSQTSTPDGYGGYLTAGGTVSFATVVGTQSCRFGELTAGNVAMFGAAPKNNATHEVVLPHTVTLNIRHKLLIGGAYYNVESENSGVDWRVATYATLSRWTVRKV